MALALTNPLGSIVVISTFWPTVAPNRYSGNRSSPVAKGLPITDYRCSNQEKLILTPM
jgi:hypothetical protein